MKTEKKQPKKSGVGVVGVAWYREADWPRASRSCFRMRTSYTIAMPNG
jgi:hypothetical protein